MQAPLKRVLLVQVLLDLGVHLRMVLGVLDVILQDLHQRVLYAVGIVQPRHVDLFMGNFSYPVPFLSLHCSTTTGTALPLRTVLSCNFRTA
jgi:hypothetical protein